MVLPPSNGGRSFRFSNIEVNELETIWQAMTYKLPSREILEALANRFSSSTERSGNTEVSVKQVLNWFQNRRYALRGKVARTSVSEQTSRAQSAGGNASVNSQMEFEARSARDGAWYDVKSFVSIRALEFGDPEVLVRFSGFELEGDEWVNIRRHVRQRSLPCEQSECYAILPGDLILCFQEEKEQAVYYDSHVVGAQRRRHDVRGCRCRFLVQYDHDQSEEIVPLIKICRRPETEYRLQQLCAKSMDVNSQNISIETLK